MPYSCLPVFKTDHEPLSVFCFLKKTPFEVFRAVRSRSAQHLPLKRRLPPPLPTVRSLGGKPVYLGQVVAEAVAAAAERAELAQGGNAG